MAKKKNISAVISLKDNFSAGLRGIKREQKSFQREVAQTRKAMESLNKKKMKARLDATQANKAFNSLKKNTKYIEAKKKLVQVVVAKDMAMAKLNKIKSTMKSLGRAIAKPAVLAKDKATSIIKGIGGKLGAIAKGITIPIMATVAAGGSLFKEGASLERQQVSMRHFMGYGNKGKSDKELNKMTSSYVSQLRKNANNTPFETGEVLNAGTRALQIASGSPKEAMKFVKLAEDMAAMNDGKTISDAMEALADAQKNNANAFLLQLLSTFYYAIITYIKRAYKRGAIWKRSVSFVRKYLNAILVKLIENTVPDNVKIVI